MKSIKTIIGKEIPIRRISNVIVVPVNHEQPKEADYRVDIFCMDQDGTFEQLPVRCYKHKDASYQHYKRAVAYAEALREVVYHARLVEEARQRMGQHCRVRQVKEAS